MTNIDDNRRATHIAAYRLETEFQRRIAEWADTRTVLFEVKDHSADSLLALMEDNPETVDGFGDALEKADTLIQECEDHLRMLKQSRARLFIALEQATGMQYGRGYQDERARKEDFRDAMHAISGLFGMLHGCEEHLNRADLSDGLYSVGVAGKELVHKAEDAAGRQLMDD